AVDAGGGGAQRATSIEVEAVFFGYQTLLKLVDRERVAERVLRGAMDDHRTGPRLHRGSGSHIGDNGLLGDRGGDDEDGVTRANVGCPGEPAPTAGMVALDEPVGAGRLGIVPGQNVGGPADEDAVAPELRMHRHARLVPSRRDEVALREGEDGMRRR